MTPSRTTISKEELGALEAEELQLPAFVVDSGTPYAEAKRLCQELSKSKVLGFDTETKPVFKKGVEPNKVALLQLSSDRLVVLFRLNTLQDSKALKPLQKLLRDKSILKVGVGIKDDVAELAKDTELVTLQVLDLRKLSSAAEIEVLSLSKLYAVLYGKRLSKGQRTSNWENETLTEAQVEYAALDAVAGYRIYQGLREFETPEMAVLDVHKTPKKKVKKKVLWCTRSRK
ncbi:MAG: 3'-5' exonuclease [Porphyromonas sp.]|nr:3'-5' exonuclease [Porphyromonas sp.]